MRDDILDFYPSPGPLTSLGPHAFWAARYGVTLTEERRAET